MDTELLDDAEAIGSADPTGVLRALATAGAQVREAIVRGHEAGVASIGDGDRPRSVLVASLGGSAMVADVLALLAGAGAPIPVTVRRGLPLPGWVGPLDLVVAVSLSGRAGGPLALAAEAGRRGARLLTVGAPDSPLADVCARARGVHVPVKRPHEPGRSAAGASSRTSFWSLLVPVLQAAYALGMVDVDDALLARVADRLDDEAEAARPASESFVNPAKVLAVQLAGSVPVVLGDGLVTGVAARRAAAMLARTARTPAVFGSLPDDASEVVATFDGPFTGRPDDVFADPFLDAPTGPSLRLLMLREPPPDPARDGQDVFEAAELADRVRGLAEDVGVAVSEVAADPGHPLERLSGLVARTDFASVYLALALGLDPGLSPHVADLRDAR
ncbi:SIS domain-containing protein [Angustibacter sp. McL0619]|uniref:SIS domain-containing protein n=1 Tax=Angustibacter sp. McL0619 TaxID=3415676 RepID=UPI003CEDCD52